MRSFKLVPAAAATAVLLALTPVAASAVRGARKHQQPHRHAKPAGSCRLKINAAPRLIEAGESVLLFGQLLCPTGTGVAGQSVTVDQRSAGTPGVSTAGTATTGTTGYFQLTSPALLSNSAFYATCQGAKSAQKNVKVSPKITLDGPPDGAQLSTGAGPLIHRGPRRNAVTFTGTVSPGDAGALAVLQRENAVGNEEWRRIGIGQVGAGGSYSITHIFGKPGDANIRVVVRPSRLVRPELYAVGSSEELSYEISQAQNPALTIKSSADPLSYGQTVAISGTVATGPNTSLTLLARTRLQSGFVAVAKAVSVGGGAYTFPIQAPLQNTFYKVAGAGKTSARTFEGVKYALTATVSSNTIQAGQPLTFLGTVTPGYAGHPVYLQAQNASGIGFHVVDVGTVTATSTYSIVHAAFTAGVHKFRIKVPGDHENQSVASTLFTIEVTPASAEALTPEAPGNSSLPSEGQI